MDGIERISVPTLVQTSECMGCMVAPVTMALWTVEALAVTVKGRFKGRFKGRVKSRAKARAKGRAKGRVEGRFKGRARVKVRVTSLMRCIVAPVTAGRSRAP